MPLVRPSQPARIPPSQNLGPITSQPAQPEVTPSAIRAETGLPNRPSPEALLPASMPDLNTIAADGLALQAELDNLVAHVDLLQSQLRQAQKLASLGATAAMIAHEFNNLFTPVVAYGRQALDTQDVPLMKKALEKTLAQVDVMRNMSDRVIGLAKQSDGSIMAVNVRKTVENAIDCLGRDLNKDNISVALQIDPALAVRANENQLLQVLFNLVINARQAMLGRRGRLGVDAVAQNGEVRLAVRDNGTGITPENLRRIFEPFFSTKQSTNRPDQRGLGLGLTICRDIIEEFGGSIDVQSEHNVGTIFTITLPQAQ